MLILNNVLSPSFVVPLVLVPIIFYCLLLPLSQYYRDPLHLRRFPAPSFWAAVTPLWLLKATWSERRSRIIHEEIQRLGDVIRISPNHLIFNQPSAIKDIYGVLAISRGIAKDDFYDRLGDGSHDLVQVRDRGEHSDRRKAIANAFAAKTVVQMEPVIRNAFLHLLKRIDRLVDDSAPHEPPVVNFRKWLNYFTLDVIADTGFGLSTNMLQNGSDTADAESEDGMRY